MRLNPVFAGQPTSIFEEMSALARRHGAVNLGQGFPESDGPEDLRRAAAAALLEGPNQYPPMRGTDALRAAVAAHYARWQGLSLEARHVVVTSGATEALAAALLAVLQPGDEAIVLDPAYDAYRPLIARAGATAVAVTLAPPDWRLTEPALTAAITARTRAIVVNTPLNPAARVFDATEMALLAETCARFDLVAISDEVWEHVVFDGRRFSSLLAQPGMAERTIKIGSAGKMFSMTGWKVGFMAAGEALIEAAAKAHQFLTFTTPPALQAAVAEGLAWPDARFAAIRAGFERARDRTIAALQAEGFAVLACEGTYFACVDLAASGIGMEAGAFCRRAAAEHGVAAIPLAPFYAEPAAAPPIIRLCFAKADATIDAGVARLAAARRALGG